MNIHAHSKNTYTYPPPPPSPPYTRAPTWPIPDLLSIAQSTFNSLQPSTDTPLPNKLDAALLALKKAKKREYDKHYYQQSKPQKQAQNKAYYIEHKEAFSERNTTMYQENKKATEEERKKELMKAMKEAELWPLDENGDLVVSDINTHLFFQTCLR